MGYEGFLDYYGEQATNLEAQQQLYKEETPFLLKLLDWTSRPFQAFFSGAANLLTGDNVIKGLKEGFEGKGEGMEKVFREEFGAGKLAAPLLGMATEVLMPLPTSFIKFAKGAEELSLIRKAGNVLKSAGASDEEILNLLRMAKEEGKIFKNIDDFVEWSLPKIKRTKFEVIDRAVDFLKNKQVLNDDIVNQINNMSHVDFGLRTPERLQEARAAAITSYGHLTNMIDRSIITSDSASQIKFLYNIARKVDKDLDDMLREGIRVRDELLNKALELSDKERDKFSSLVRTSLLQIGDDGALIASRKIKDLIAEVDKKGFVDELNSLLKLESFGSTREIKSLNLLKDFMESDAGKFFEFGRTSSPVGKLLTIAESFNKSVQDLEAIFSTPQEMASKIKNVLSLASKSPEEVSKMSPVEKTLHYIIKDKVSSSVEDFEKGLEYMFDLYQKTKAVPFYTPFFKEGEKIVSSYDLIQAGLKGFKLRAPILEKESSVILPRMQAELYRYTIGAIKPIFSKIPIFRHSKIGNIYKDVNYEAEKLINDIDAGIRGIQKGRDAGKYIEYAKALGKGVAGEEVFKEYGDVITSYNKLKEKIAKILYPGVVPSEEVSKEIDRTIAAILENREAYEMFFNSVMSINNTNKVLTDLFVGGEKAVEKIKKEIDFIATSERKSLQEAIIEWLQKKGVFKVKIERGQGGGWTGAWQQIDIRAEVLTDSGVFGLDRFASVSEFSNGQFADILSTIIHEYLHKVQATSPFQLIRSTLSDYLFMNKILRDFPHPALFMYSPVFYFETFTGGTKGIDKFAQKISRISEYIDEETRKKILAESFKLLKEGEEEVYTLSFLKNSFEEINKIKEDILLLQKKDARIARELATAKNKTSLIQKRAIIQKALVDSRNRIKAIENAIIKYQFAEGVFSTITPYKNLVENIAEVMMSFIKASEKRKGFNSDEFRKFIRAALFGKDFGEDEDVLWNRFLGKVRLITNAKTIEEFANSVVNAERFKAYSFLGENIKNLIKNAIIDFAKENNITNPNELAKIYSISALIHNPSFFGAFNHGAGDLLNEVLKEVKKVVKRITEKGEEINFENIIKEAETTSNFNVPSVSLSSYYPYSTPIKGLVKNFFTYIYDIHGENGLKNFAKLIKERDGMLFEELIDKTNFAGRILSAKLVYGDFLYGQPYSFVSKEISETKNAGVGYFHKYTESSAWLVQHLVSDLSRKINMKERGAINLLAKNIAESIKGVDNVDPSFVSKIRDVLIDIGDNILIKLGLGAEREASEVSRLTNIQSEKVVKAIQSKILNIIEDIHSGKLPPMLTSTGDTAKDFLTTYLQIQSNLMKGIIEGLAKTPEEANNIIKTLDIVGKEINEFTTAWDKFMDKIYKGEKELFTKMGKDYAEKMTLNYLPHKMSSAFRGFFSSLSSKDKEYITRFVFNVVDSASKQRKLLKLTEYGKDVLSTSVRDYLNGVFSSAIKLFPEARIEKVFKFFEDVFEKIKAAPYEDEEVLYKRLYNIIKEVSESKYPEIYSKINFEDKIDAIKTVFGYFTGIFRSFYQSNIPISSIDVIPMFSKASSVYDFFKIYYRALSKIEKKQLETAMFNLFYKAKTLEKENIAGVLEELGRFADHAVEKFNNIIGSKKLAHLIGDEKTFHHLFKNGIIRSATIEDIEKAFKSNKSLYLKWQKYLVEKGLPKDTELFIKNPLELAREKYYNFVENLGRYGGINYVLKDAEELGLAVKVGSDTSLANRLLDKGWVKMSPKSIGGKIAKGYLLHPAFHDVYRRLLAVSFDAVANMSQKSASLLKKLARLYTQFWRGMVTVYRPGYHVRNMVGNKVLMLESDIPLVDILSMEKNFGLKLRKLMFKAKNEEDLLLLIEKDKDLSSLMLKTADGRDLPLSELLKEGFTTGVSRGYTEVELSKMVFSEKESLLPQAIKGKSIPSKVANKARQSYLKLVKFGRKIGNMIEGSDRMLTYIWARTHGYSTREAVTFVNKVLFDYEHLPEVVQELRQTAVPFIAWAYNNIPRQLGLLVEKPYKVLAPFKISAASRSFLSKRQKKYEPEYLKERVPVYFPQNIFTYALTGKVLAFGLENYLPQVDLANIFTLKNWLSMVSPLYKAPFELASGKNIYTGKDLFKDKSQLGYVFGIPISPSFGGKKTEYVIKNIAPIISDIERVNPFNVFGKPEGSGWLGYEGVSKYISSVPQTARLGRYLTGVHFLSYDVINAMQNKHYELLKREISLKNLMNYYINSPKEYEYYQNLYNQVKAEADAIEQELKSLGVNLRRKKKKPLQEAYYKLFF